MGCNNTTEKKPQRTPSTHGHRYIPSESTTKVCVFCQKPISTDDVNHSLTCVEREVTCWNSWCRMKLRQGDLQSHIEQCQKMQKPACPKCGIAVPMIDFQSHMESCSPVPCPECTEKCIGRIKKYCPKLMIRKMNLSIGPFAINELRTKFVTPGNTLGEVHFNVARIQHLYRWVKMKSLIEDTLFRLIHKEMDLKKEGFAMFKAHDKDFSPMTPRKSRSILMHPQIVAPSDNHYFPSKPGSSITNDHIVRMIGDLRKHILLPYNAAWRVFNDTLTHFNSMPNVVPLSQPAGTRLVNGRWQQGGKIVVVGDLHGQLSDLLHILKECGMPGDYTFYVFNGDFVDRGPYGVEILLVLFCLVLAFPKYVTLNRGNHECDYMNEEYGFDVEVNTKYDRNMYKLIQRCFCALPLATIIDNKVFIVHGGLPRRKGATIMDINRIQRFRQVPMPEQMQPEEDELFQDLLWSDPCDRQGWVESDRGAGVQFGADLTSAFMACNDLKLIIRSHEEFAKGYEEHHDGRLFTVFSASNYDGPDTNNGAFIVLAGMINEPSFYTYQVYEDDFEAGDIVESEVNRTFSEMPTSVALTRTFTSAITGKVVRRKRVKDEVLRVLRELIYQRRHRLLAYFTKLDRTRKGSVWKMEWVETMRNVLNLDIPWFFLRRYVADEDGRTARIQYLDFLRRYHNQLTGLWYDEWKKDMLTTVLGRARGARGILTHELTGKKSLNYNEFCHIFRNVDHTIGETELFQMFVVFNKGRGSDVETSVVLEEANQLRGPSQLSNWDLEALEQFQLLMMQGRTQLPSIFSITSKERTLTLEKYLAGMTIVARSMRKQLSESQRVQIFNFLTNGKDEINFDLFLCAFNVYFDSVELSRRASAETIIGPT